MNGFDRNAEVFTIAAWFAIATGIIEGCVLLFQRIALDQFIWTSTSVFWMAPISYLVFFLLIAFLLWLLMRVVPRARSSGLALIVFSFISVLSLLSLLIGSRVHIAALALLAAGIGVQVARFGQPHGEMLAPRMRRSALAMIAVVMVSALATSVVGKSREQRLLEDRPAARAGAPNVLFVVLDCVRAASTSLHGYALPTTPKLQEWASRGVVFETAIATAPWTLPSHASMFTGRWPHELSSSWLRPLDETYPTIAEAFRDQGYQTGALTANYFYTTRETGLARGFTHFEARPVSVQQVLLSSVIGQELHEVVAGYSIAERASHRLNARVMTTKALDWIGDAKQPFFLFMNYYDAHKPYRFDEAEGVAFEVRGDGRRAYDAALATMDEQLDRLLRELEQKGVLRNTIVVVTSDHGETFGSHGLRGHGHSLYLDVLHVPLVVIHPQLVPAGRRVKQPVSLRNIPATLAVLAQLDKRFEGVALSEYWNGNHIDADRSPVLSEVWPGRNDLPKNQPASRGEMVSLVRDTLHYIRNADGREELYNLARDPNELQNLAATASGPVLTSFRYRATAAQQRLEARFSRGN
jgi:arylsulfatase A-like enzyme